MTAMKKFKLTDETKVWWGKTLYRIEALVDFAAIKKGERGGWVGKEGNLSHDGDAWVSDNALVSGNARVWGNADVSGDARVLGDARVSDNTWVSGDAWVSGNARGPVITHPHADFDTALSDTWSDAVGTFADELPSIARRLAKAHAPSTAEEHEAAIVEYFVDHAGELLVDVLKEIGEWRKHVNGAIQQREYVESLIDRTDLAPAQTAK